MLQGVSRTNALLHQTSCPRFCSTDGQELLVVFLLARLAWMLDPGSLLPAPAPHWFPEVGPGSMPHPAALGCACARADSDQGRAAATPGRRRRCSFQGWHGASRKRGITRKSTHAPINNTPFPVAGNAIESNGERSSGFVIRGEKGERIRPLGTISRDGMYTLP